MLGILIIEDNETDYLLLLRQIKMVLAEAECTRVENRIEVERALVKSWDLIITDFHLPDIEERELLDVIAAARPETPCLVLSGSVQQLKTIAMPDNVFDRIEKGDHTALRAALLGRWLTP